jgi:hypothetical protein
MLLDAPLPDAVPEPEVADPVVPDAVVPDPVVPDPVVPVDDPLPDPLALAIVPVTSTRCPACCFSSLSLPSSMYVEFIPELPLPDALEADVPLVPEAVVPLVPDPVVPLVPEAVVPAPLPDDAPLPPRAEPIIAFVSMNVPLLEPPALDELADPEVLDEEPLPLCRQPVTVIVPAEPLREDGLV